MRAAEAFWLGRDEAFDFAIDKKLPPDFQIGTWLENKRIITGSTREGFGWRQSDLDALDPISPFMEQWKMGTKVDVVASEATDKSKESLESLREELKRFREHIKNDLTSMKAGSDRVQTEVNKMTQAYEKAISVLTSAEFNEAVLNAERMATALEAISKLSETKLSMAVFKGAS